MAFFGGEETEKMLIERDYFGLVKHINRVLRIRVWHGIVEEGIIKWLWGSFGVRFTGLTVETITDVPPSSAFAQYQFFSRYPAWIDWI